MLTLVGRTIWSMLLCPLLFDPRGLFFPAELVPCLVLCIGLMHCGNAEFQNPEPVQSWCLREAALPVRNQKSKPPPAGRQ